MTLKTITYRIVLVGNVAQTLHPTAGQGFSPGLRDVISLAETSTQAQNGVEDMGDYAVLACYQQRRERDRETTTGAISNLVYLFANHWIPLVAGHNVGLMVTELFIPAHDALAERTLGQVARQIRPVGQIGQRRHPAKVPAEMPDGAALIRPTDYKFRGTNSAKR